MDFYIFSATRTLRLGKLRSSHGELCSSRIGLSDDGFDAILNAIERVEPAAELGQLFVVEIAGLVTK